MPLQRSPSKATHEELFKIGSMDLQQSTSTPNLAETEDIHITMRPLKRKQGADDFGLFMSKMEEMFCKWQEKQDSKLDNVLTSISSQNEQITVSLATITKQHEQMKETVDQLIKNRDEELLYIKSLEDKIEVFEKKSRSTSVEIRNIPQSTNETTEELASMAIKLGSIVAVPIQMTEIKNIFRVNRKNENKPVILELTTDLLKNNLIKSFKKYSINNGPNSPNTQDLGIEGQVKKIFLSECLTPKTHRLFFLAREYAKVHDYKYCWTAHGNVFLRKQQGNPTLPIKDESDFEKITNSVK